MPSILMLSPRGYTELIDAAIRLAFGADRRVDLRRIEIDASARRCGLRWRLGIEWGFSLLQSGANEPRKLSRVAGPCDMHVKRRRIGAQQMVVQGGHLKALGKQLAHHRIDLAFGEDEVAHHHRLVPHRLEGYPAAEGEAGFDGHSIE